MSWELFSAAGCDSRALSSCPIKDGALLENGTCGREAFVLFIWILSLAVATPNKEWLFDAAAAASAALWWCSCCCWARDAVIMLCCRKESFWCWFLSSSSYEWSRSWFWSALLRRFWSKSCCWRLLPNRDLCIALSEGKAASRPSGTPRSWAGRAIALSVIKVEECPAKLAGEAAAVRCLGLGEVWDSLLESLFRDGEGAAVTELLCCFFDTSTICNASCGFSFWNRVWLKAMTLRESSGPISFRKPLVSRRNPLGETQIISTRGVRSDVPIMWV